MGVLDQEALTPTCPTDHTGLKGLLEVYLVVCQCTTVVRLCVPPSRDPALGSPRKIKVVFGQAHGPNDVCRNEHMNSCFNQSCGFCELLESALVLQMIEIKFRLVE